MIPPVAYRPAAVLIDGRAFTVEEARELARRIAEAADEAHLFRPVPAVEERPDPDCEHNCWHEAWEVDGQRRTCADCGCRLPDDLSRRPRRVNPI